MKIIVFGATGSIGKLLVRQALDAGHDVTAFARNPESLAGSHPSLTTVAGDVFDPAAVARAVKDQDAVCVTLGSKKLTGTLRSTGTANIIRAMKDHGVDRLICQSTLGTGDSRKNLDFWWKYVMFGLILRGVYNDHIIQETLVRESGLDWTIARPAAFTDDPANGEYRHGFGPQEKNINLKIARGDVAGFILKELEQPRYLHQSPGLSQAA